MLFLKVDPRIVDALVAHALSAPVGRTGGEEVKAQDDEIEDVVPVVDAVEGAVEVEDDA